MTLDDVVNVLKQLLEKFPELETAADFDAALTARRRYVGTLQRILFNYNNQLEQGWAKLAWEKVRHKPGKWYRAGQECFI